MVLSHYLYKGTNTQHVAGMQERSYDFSKGGGGGVKQMKLTGLSSRPPCRVYSERSSSPKHTMSYFEQREQDFNCAPMARKCVTRKCGVSWAPQGAAVKNRVENRKFKAHSHLPPHCPPTWKYTNHFSLTTSGLN